MSARCRVLTFKEADAFAALDAALPLCPGPETLQAVLTAVASGLGAEAQQPDRTAVSAICSWAVACPRGHVAARLASSCSADPSDGGAAANGVSAEPQRIDFACTLLGMLGDTAPGCAAVDMHRFVAATMRLHPEPILASPWETVDMPKLVYHLHDMADLGDGSGSDCAACTGADRCECATTSAIMAWLDDAATWAAAPSSDPRRQRTAQLLCRLAEGSMLQPLAYVDWLVAHGILTQAASDGTAVASRAEWHRQVPCSPHAVCVTRIWQPDETNAPFPSLSCAFVNIEPHS